MKKIKILIIILIVFAIILGIVILGLSKSNKITTNTISNSNQTQNGSKIINTTNETFNLVNEIANETNQSTNNIVAENNVEHNHNEIDEDEIDEAEISNGDLNTDYSLKEVEILNYRGSYYAIKDILNSYFNNQFIIYNTYIYSKSPSIDLFWIEGTKKNSNELTNVIVITDSKNYTWKLFEEDEIRQSNCTVENFRNIEIEEIDYNGVNGFEYQVSYEKNYVNDLLRDYIEKAIYCTEYVYNNILDEVCRDNMFPTLEDYEKYLDENKEIIALHNSTKDSEIVKNYSAKQYKQDIEYTITDKNGKKYIFNVTSTMKYTVSIPE